MVFLIVFALIGFVILYLLFIPIILNIDTRTNLYYLNIKGLAKASLERHDTELLRINLRALFRNFYFFPLKSKAKKSTKKSGLQKFTSKKRNNRKRVKTLWRLMRSFRVNKMFIDIDTGDCIYNAKLYPVFAFLNYRYGGFHVNFENRNQLVLQIQNRAIDIIKSFINLKI